jgi:hypothetical protein
MRRFCYIIEIEGKPIEKQFFVENRFFDERLALKDFKIKIRDELLKKYMSVKCAIFDCDKVQIGQLFEERITKQQRTIDLLQRK